MFATLLRDFDFCVQDWTLLDCKKNAYLAAPDDVHQFIKCVVTPFSLDGRMGEVQEATGFIVLSTKYKEELRKVLAS